MGNFVQLLFKQSSMLGPLYKIDSKQWLLIAGLFYGTAGCKC